MCISIRRRSVIPLVNAFLAGALLAALIANRGARLTTAPAHAGGPSWSAWGARPACGGHAP